MLMYQKKLVEFQIGKDDNNNNNTIVGQQSSSSFSDLSIKIPSCFLQSSSHQKQSTSTPPRLQIRIPPFSSTNSPRDNQNKNEPFFRNHSSTKTLVSFPHKRSSMISQTPSFGQPETSGSHYYHQKASVLNSDSSSYHSSFLCSPSSPVFLATKRITLKFIHNSCHASWFRVHLKVFILISLPSVYLLTLTRHWPFLIHFLYVLAFSALLVIALNYLALPRLPSIRLFLARILCIKLTPPKHHHPPVVWSIGTKPKPEKRPLSISGSWVQVYSNGDVYEGEFHKGKCSGSGVYYYNLSGRYEGDWVDEKYDGYGVETWAKGSRYRGQYRQGLRHGVGMYRSYTGDSYSGEWCNGQCHGVGMHTCEDGSSYFGEFKWGSKHELGHYHFRNGDTYAGEYFADRMHGFGVYRFGNSHKYEGAWHEGRRQGFGTYTFRSGETQSGHWQNGVLSSSTAQGTLTGSSFAVDHAKVLHAVQEARRAAEKAAEVLNADERVKRAVAAANKAATAARVAAVRAVQNQMHEYDDSNNSPSTVV